MRPPQSVVIPWAAHKSWETLSIVNGRLAYSLIDLLLSSASSRETSPFNLGSGNLMVAKGAGGGVGDRFGDGPEQAQPKANKTVSSEMPKRFIFISTSHRPRIRDAGPRIITEIGPRA